MDGQIETAGEAKDDMDYNDRRAGMQGSGKRYRGIIPQNRGVRWKKRNKEDKWNETARCPGRRINTAFWNKKKTNMPV